MGALIVIAEDEPEQLEIVLAPLERAGYSTVAVQNGKEAFDVIRSTSPDLAILDWNMPGMTGPEIIRELRSHHDTADIYLILLTGMADEQSRIEGIEAGADDYLTKPFRSRELLARVSIGMRIRQSIKTLTDEVNVLHRAVDQSPASIVITDTSGTIQYVNRKFCEVTGYSIEEAAGKTPRILKSGEKTPSEYEALWTTITTGKEWKGRFHNKRKSGDFFWEQALICPIKNDRGEITHFLAIKEDITERVAQEEIKWKLEEELRKRNAELEKMVADLKLMQNSLVQSEKMASVGQLTAGIAHEINNPLAFVSSNLNRIQEYFADIVELLAKWRALSNSLQATPEGAAQLKEINEYAEQIDLPFLLEDFPRMMESIHEGAGRIKKIVEGLRGFAHMSQDDVNQVQLNNAIDDTLLIVWNELKYKADLKKELDELPPVTCNAGEIKQVIVNLLVNAAHAIVDRGTITISTRADEKYVYLSIGDTGSGIAPENLRRIFDPFFTTKPVGKGTGLGLWISSSIVQKHGGTISVNSELGKGTTFTVKLPITQEEIQVSKEQ